MRLGSSIRRRQYRSDGRFTWPKKDRWLALAGVRLKLTHGAVVVAVLLVSFGLGYTIATRLVFPLPAPPGDLTQVPDVRGLDGVEARRLIEAVGLSVVVADSFRHPAAVKGKVMGQSPLGGQLAVAGDTIRLTASLGPVRRPVPDVVRLSISSARNVLGASGFTVAVDSLEDVLPAGQVFEILPEAGTEVDLPMEVRIAMSTGPPLVAMPFLLGIEQANAEAMLDSLGLVISEIITRFRFGRDQGRVVAQDPAADSLVAPGSPVSLVVGRRSGPRRNRN